MPKVTVHQAVQVGGKVYAEGTHELTDAAIKALRDNGRGDRISVAGEPAPQEGGDKGVAAAEEAARRAAEEQAAKAAATPQTATTGKAKAKGDDKPAGGDQAGG